jgi:hypothetical protein
MSSKTTVTVFSKVTLMLLGPSSKLDLRRRIKEALVKKGYEDGNIIIMETIKDDEHYFDKKFGNILDKYRPLLFFAFFHKNEKMHGVIFELGWICGEYSRVEISERLRIVSEIDYGYKHTTRYIQSILHTSQELPVEKMNIKQISQCIHDNVDFSLNRWKSLSGLTDDEFFMKLVESDRR